MDGTGHADHFLNAWVPVGHERGNQDGFRVSYLPEFLLQQVGRDPVSTVGPMNMSEWWRFVHYLAPVFPRPVPVPCGGAQGRIAPHAGVVDIQAVN